MIKSPLAREVYPAYPGNYTVGRSGRKIEAITIHHMAGRLTAKGCGEIFQKPGRNGSSHYGIGYNGEIACYVGEENTAWTNSNWDSNCKSVTIETSDADSSWYVNDVTLNSLIKLVADIAKRNNLGTLVKGKNVTWHSMYANTSCPGNYLLSKMDYIIAEANKINSPSESVNIYYQVETKEDGVLPMVKNTEDYAGYKNHAIRYLAMKVDKGSVKYRVTTISGKTLDWVTGCNIKDHNLGCAGNGEPIATVEAIYYTPEDIVKNSGYRYIYYKVNNYPYQKDTIKGNGFDGFAGEKRVIATKFQAYIDK